MSEIKEAAEAVIAWAEQFATLGGVDPEVAHRANRAELRVPDLVMLASYALSDRKIVDAFDTSKIADIPIGMVERVLNAAGLSIGFALSEEPPVEPWVYVE